ncbi:RWD domain-containing protein 4-like isoform X1 [Amphibalanus amphitrite]|uniref:RWD domain-containing protein 4-like isoform X1 n=1 Tax=Amphibalanus amphitrite TaxID=1232801 RepID=UPI001C917D88|nr:RWD domain-containing protein 4-like isoform X1 [Amphibalanus amphitrite]XP_043232718.1 RWD domain-containing protein 4-like isoform X1 [Amphibalanus amphitrite]
MSAEMQAEELEVLRSIYEGDPSYIEVDEKTFQYKYGEDGDIKSFLVEVKWTENYPDELPNINLDAFYNKHILPAVKEHVVDQVRQQADTMLGMSMTFTLFEWVKESVTELMAEQTAAPPVSQATEEVEQLTITQVGGGGVKKEKKEQLSKQQKRRAWDRAQVGGGGERARGWDWVDIIRHLSQTAPS